MYSCGLSPEKPRNRTDKNLYFQPTTTFQLDVLSLRARQLTSWEMFFVCPFFFGGGSLLGLYCNFSLRKASLGKALLRSRTLSGHVESKSWLEALVPYSANHSCLEKDFVPKFPLNLHALVHGKMLARSSSTILSLFVQKREKHPLCAGGLGDRM